MKKYVARKIIHHTVYSRLSYLRSYLSLKRQVIRQRVMDALQRANEQYSPFLLPDPFLRFQVHGKLDPRSFVENAYDIADTIYQILRKHEIYFQDMDNVLDFGCGPGKITQTLWLNYISSPPHCVKLYGTDINAEAISWARKNLPFASFSVNRPLPPTSFESDFFDFIYVGSVFTHLDQNFEAAWIDELHRVAKKDGYIIATFHGAYAISSLRMTPQEINRLKDEGFLYRPYKGGYKKDGLPEFYTSTYHTREYIEKTYSRKFEIIDYVEKGLRNYQDLVLMYVEK